MKFWHMGAKWITPSCARQMRRGSIATRLFYDLGHGARILVAHRLEPRHDAFAVSGVAVLARLPFATDVEDFDLEADDRPALHGDEIGGRVADRPGLLTTRFQSLGQL